MNKNELEREMERIRIETNIKKAIAFFLCVILGIGAISLIMTFIK